MVQSGFPLSPSSVNFLQHLLFLPTEKDDRFKGRVYYGSVDEDLPEEGEVILDQELKVRDKSKLVGGK